MIYDCVMFRDELSMLEVRLSEFAEIPGYRLLLVEAPVSHRGDSKSLHYADNAERFAKWSDSIVHIVAGELDAAMAPWPREHAQRDAAMGVLETVAQPDDIVFIGDVDEFWPQGFDFASVRPVVAFDQRLAMYAVDWLYPELHRCSVSATWRYVKANGGLAKVRDGRYGYRGVQGGWHLTWLGGLEGQRAKLQVTCHTEMTEAEYDRIWSGACYERGEHHSGQCRMIPVDVDQSWPRMIFERQVPPSWFRPREEACA